MIHEMVMIDYTGAQQDGNYPAGQYGEIYITPPNVATHIDAETTEMLNNQDLSDAEDYYSNIPGAPDEGRMSMDFYGGKDVDKGSQVSDPANPRYVREGTYIPIRATSVPSTEEAQQLAERIRKRSTMVSEPDRIGSSKHHHRNMIISEKKRLLKIIKKMEE